MKKPEERYSDAATPRAKRRQGQRMGAVERKDLQERFLAAYALNGNIMLSCKRVGIERATFYRWTEHDETFSLLFNQATKDFAEFALAEFTKRAIQGYEKPVVSMGRIVYEEEPLTDVNGKPVFDEKGHQRMVRKKPLTERVVSDTLLAMLIKRHFPEFREKTQADVNMHHSGAVGDPNAISFDPKKLSKQDVLELRAIAERMAEREG